MKEDLLQYIWLFQQFDKRDLTTTEGLPLRILRKGTLNKDAGPDFLDARVLLDGVHRCGAIELHVKASAWYEHGHQRDEAYNQTILHVVWKDDKQVKRKDGTPLPTLVLQGCVKEKLLARYAQLMVSHSPIACKAHLGKVTKERWYGMLEKALLHRFTEKHKLVYSLLKENKDDSQATAYQLLAYNFGFKINSDIFLRLSKQVPFALIQKNTTSLLHIEALLLGQAGLLPTSLPQTMRGDSYAEELITTYQYLTHKYKLAATLKRWEWKFFRLRPANFPFIRIAQFARVLHTHRALFDLLINTPPKKLCEKLTLKQSPYWQQHYQLGKKSKAPIPGLGHTSIHNLLINTVAPLLVTYGKLRDAPHYINRAMDLLRGLPWEQNTITKRWRELGLPIKDAFDSQASLTLFKSFCENKKCLSCDIGVGIVGNKR